MDLHPELAGVIATVILWSMRYTEPPMPTPARELVNLPDAEDRRPAIASRV
jgi:hypothetical protein